MNEQKAPSPDSPFGSAHGLQTLLEAAPIAIVVVDRRGTILYLNQKLEELFGYPRTELINRSVEVLLPEQLRTVHAQHRKRYMAAPHVRTMGSGMNLVGRRRDGTVFPLEAGLSTVAVGGELLAIASVVDVTIRKQAAETLERRVHERTVELERRRRVADGLRDILAVLNSNQSLDETLKYVVMQAGMLLGAGGCAIFRLSQKAQTLSVQVSQGLSGAYLESATAAPDAAHLISRAMRLRQPLTLPSARVDVQEEHKTQEALAGSGYRSLMVVPLLLQGEEYGALALYYAQARHFTGEEIELASTFGDQAALAIENAHLRAQAQAAAVTAERNRIARDLHDSVTQTLFSANMIADILPRLWDRDEEAGRQRLDELHDLTRGALAEMRTMLLELRPAILMDADLHEVLQQLVDATKSRVRLPIVLQIEGEHGSLPADVRLALYRITQEALNNVAKHAQASHVTVALRCEENAAELAITDDGVGFVVGGVRGNHLGLTIMRERAAAIGAAITIASEPGQGTEILLLWYNPSNRQPAFQQETQL